MTKTLLFGLISLEWLFYCFVYYEDKFIDFEQKLWQTLKDIIFICKAARKRRLSIYQFLKICVIVWRQEKKERKEKRELS